MASSIQTNGSCHRPVENGHLTRTIDLQTLEMIQSIPDQASAIEFRQVYQTCVDSGTPAAQQLKSAIESFRAPSAPPIAFPTETVYGLGADATNSVAIKSIFTTKGRPSDNPLIVHVASLSQLEQWTSQAIPDIYTTLVQEFWPGPLTILLPVPPNSRFAPNVHPGQNTIGFRIPSSKYARFVIAAADRPIAAPSANTSGRPSPTTTRHVFDDLNGKIDWVLDGGSCDVGLESTVVDGLHDPPLVLRPGGISLEALVDHGLRHNNAWSRTREGYKQHEHKTNGSTLEDASDAAPRAPGMKYRHYTPNGKLILFNTPFNLESFTSKLDDILPSMSPGCAIGIIDSTRSRTWLTSPTSPFTASLATVSAQDRDLIPSSWIAHTTISTYSSSQRSHGPHRVYTLHVGADVNKIAQKLFDMLRLFDDLGCEVILANWEAWADPITKADAAIKAEADTTYAADADNRADTNGDIVGGQDKLEHKLEPKLELHHELRDALRERIEKAAFEIVGQQQ